MDWWVSISAYINILQGENVTNVQLQAALLTNGLARGVTQLECLIKSASYYAAKKFLFAFNDTQLTDKLLSFFTNISTQFS